MLSHPCTAHPCDCRLPYCTGAANLTCPCCYLQARRNRCPAPASRWQHARAPVHEEVCQDGGAAGRHHMEQPPVHRVLNELPQQHAARCKRRHWAAEQACAQRTARQQCRHRQPQQGHDPPAAAQGAKCNSQRQCCQPTCPPPLHMLASAYHFTFVTASSLLLSKNRA